MQHVGENRSADSKHFSYWQRFLPWSHIILVVAFIFLGLQYMFMIGNETATNTEKQRDTEIQIHGLLVNI